MESETLTFGCHPRTRERVFAAVGPVLWIAISYLDPGKWAAAVEGGSRFGFDLSLLVLIINCAAILCQYLPARIAIATGKNLAQICSEEYDDLTCLLLGIQAEISMVVLDLTMVLGTAYGLNAVFGMDLLISVFFTGLDVVLFPFLASLLGSTKAKTIAIFVACFLLVSYVAGVLISQPESSLSAGGMLSKLTGENAYALMGVLGANIMPHNFYLHSSIVQQDKGKPNISKEALCHDHFFATLCIFSAIFLVNCMIMNSAANVFYGSGLISLTLQDALSLLDQGFKSFLASTALIFIMFFSNQLVAVTWSQGRQVTVHDFFRLEIPGWLHRATIKLIAIIAALFCVLYSGTDGIFQLLIFTQVLVGLLLPSSVIPLFRVASSSSIMGAYKISHLMEFLALFSFIGMLGLKIIFVIELVFGSSDWVISLRWNIGSSVPISYLILLIAASASMCLMFWLAITPLKSVSSGVEMQGLKWERKNAIRMSSIDRDQSESSEVRHHLENSTVKQEHVSSLQSHQNILTPTSDLNLPETLLDSDTNLHPTTIQENKAEISFPKPSIVNPDESRRVSELILPESSEIVEGELMDSVTLIAEPKAMMERTLKIDGNTNNEKDEGRESWESKESIKYVSESSQSLTSEGPGSYRNIRGKNDDVGSGTGSLSRLAGLGRAGRRQLTTHFDEFWGQLFDFHGQPTLEARARKFDVLLGVDSKLDSKSASVKSESTNKDSSGYLPSSGGRGTNLLRNSTFYGPMQQQIEQGNNNSGSTLRVQQGLSVWSSNQMELSEAHIRNSSHDSLDAGERRYRSMHVPSSSSIHDQLGVDSKLDPKSASVKSESTNKDSTGYLPSGGRGTNVLRNSRIYDPMQQQIEQGNNNSGSTLRIQQGLSVWSSNQMELSEAYMRNSSHDSLDAGERRYRSMHAPSSSSSHDQLGVDSKLDPKSASVKSESTNQDSTGYLPSSGGRGTDLLRNSRLYGPMQQQIEQGNNNSGSTLRVQQGLSVWSSNQMELSEAYMRNSSHDSLDAGERRYRSMHVPSSSSGHDQLPATFHDQKAQTLTPSIKSNSIDSYGQPLVQKPLNGMRMMKPPGFHNTPVARNHSMKPERAFHELSPEPVDYSSNNPPSVKKFHSLPDISVLGVPQRYSMSDNNSSQWHNNNSMGYGQSVSRAVREHMSSTSLSETSTGLGFKEISTPKVCKDVFSLPSVPSSSAGSLWSRQPYEQFGVADKSPPKTQETASVIDMEANILQSFRSCIMDLLKLEGSDWLFRHDEGVDEDLIARVAARERFLFEVETRTMERKYGSPIKIDETVHLKSMPVPNCGDGCVWGVDLVISFGVWSIHRILELSLVESRPELWGKYTYALNRLQGIIDLAFSKPRPSLSPCFCLQLPVGYQQKLSPPISNGSLLPHSKVGREKFTTAAMLLDTIKDIEMAISCRKGRTGTAAGDVAFPKGKENLASVLKRYKRRLSGKLPVS